MRSWSSLVVDAALREPEDYLTQIVQVAGQPVHRMADDRITFTDVACKLYELRTVEILARGLIDETLIERDAFQLTQFLLIERADPQIANHLTGLPLPFCRVRF